MNKRIAFISIALALYTILICISSSIYAKRELRQQIQLKAGAALQRVKSDSETVVRARWHRNRGTVRSLYNLTLPAPIGTLETSTRQCLNDYCDLFAMTDPNIELRLVDIQSSLTGRHVRFHQYHNGIEVYGAAISIHNQPLWADTRYPQQLLPTNQHQYNGIVLSGPSDRHRHCRGWCIRFAQVAACRFGNFSES